MTSTGPRNKMTCRQTALAPCIHRPARQPPINWQSYQYANHTWYPEARKCTTRVTNPYRTRPRSESRAAKTTLSAHQTTTQTNFPEVHAQPKYWSIMAQTWRLQGSAVQQPCDAPYMHRCNSRLHSLKYGMLPPPPATYSIALSWQQQTTIYHTNWRPALYASTTGSPCPSASRTPFRGTEGPRSPSHAGASCWCFPKE